MTVAHALEEAGDPEGAVEPPLALGGQQRRGLGIGLVAGAALVQGVLHHREN